MDQPEQEDPRNWAAVEMSPEARRYFEQAFLPRHDDFARQLASTPLSVLVWGPGSSGKELYEKRLQIRGRLRDAGFAAVFSEELAERAGPKVSAKAAELVQAMAADFIVVLMSSFGSVAEVHDFGSSPILAAKMLVFVREGVDDGYSAKGLLQEMAKLYHNVRTFSQADVIECRLLGSVMERLEVLRVAKWRLNREIGHF